MLSVSSLRIINLLAAVLDCTSGDIWHMKYKSAEQLTSAFVFYNVGALKGKIRETLLFKTKARCKV